MGKKRILFIFGRIDVVLMGIALAMVAIGALLLWLFPRWWGFYVTLLDVRIWPPWKCIGLAVVLIESLLVIRHWPDKDRRRSARTKTNE